jgi:hypothetical protein
MQMRAVALLCTLYIELTGARSSYYTGSELSFPWLVGCCFCGSASIYSISRVLQRDICAFLWYAKANKCVGVGV